jgi:hypothetical protein
MKQRSLRGRHLPALHAAAIALSLAVSGAYAAKPEPAAGVDLDIVQFRATPKVDLTSRHGSEIRIDLSVRNNGSLDQTRSAILTGRATPGNNLVFQRRIPVADEPGGGPTAYTIVPTDMGLVPPPGRIIWTLFITDDDPDDDTDTATTIVRP